MNSLPFPARRPRSVLIAWFMVINAMMFFLVLKPGIEINPTYKSMILRDDKDLSLDTKVKQKLGDDEIIVLAIENPKTVFDIPTLTYIDQLTTAVENIAGVRKVYSLTRADNIRGKDGTMDANDLIVELPRTPEDVARIEKEAFENPLFIDMIVAKDKKVASINIELETGHTTKDDSRIALAVYDAIAKAEKIKPADVKMHVSGFPIASHLGGTYMIQDMAIFSGLSMIVLTIIMWLVLRSWHGVFFTMFVTMSAVSVTYGLMAVMGIAITMPLSAIMAFMTAIGMEYSVYVAFAYMHAVQTGHGEKGPALGEGMKEVKFTVVISAACTAAAFGSMLTHPVHDLKLQGSFLAIGTLVCCFAALTIIPAWIQLWGLPVPPKEKMHWRRLQGLIDKIARWDTRKPWHVIAGLVVLIGIGGFLMTKMSSDTDAFQYFKKSSTIYQDDQFIRARMAGDTLLQVVVEAKENDTFKDPANLAKLEKISQYAETLPHVTKAISHADHIKLLNEALKSGTPADYKLPDTKAAVEQFLLLHNQPDDFHLWIDDDYKLANIGVRMNSMSSTTLRKTEHALETFMKTQFPSYEVNALGTTILAHRAFDIMAEATLTGILTATLFIWIIMVIGFKSIRIGTIALLPTLPPALMVYSTLPLIGHPLDPPTSITGAIALGIAIDDTTWFLRTWIMERRKGVDVSTAISQTLTAIGRPMVLSSCVLGAGFAIMLFSRYGVLFWLGVMMSLVAFWSVFWDMLGTPTLIRLFDPKLPKLRKDEM